MLKAILILSQAFKIGLGVDFEANSVTNSLEMWCMNASERS